MTLEDLAAELAPDFPGCPFPTLIAKLEQIQRELESQGIEYPDEFPEALSFGARWKLFSMNGREWADRTQAQDNYTLYREARHKAKVATAHAAPDYTGRSTVPGF